MQQACEGDQERAIAAPHVPGRQVSHRDPDYRVFYKTYDVIARHEHNILRFAFVTCNHGLRYAYVVELVGTPVSSR